MFLSGLNTFLHSPVIYEMFVKTDKHFEKCNRNHFLGIPIEGKRERERMGDIERERELFSYTTYAQQLHTFSATSRAPLVYKVVIDIVNN